MRGGPKHLAPALSLRDPCPHPRVRGDLFVLLRDRYLQAVLGLRIRSAERTRVDAAGHQVLELPLLPGLEEVGVHGGVHTRRELHLATSGWDGELEVRLEPRYGVWVAGRAPRRPGVDHVRAVVVGGEAGGGVGGVPQRLPARVYSEAVGEKDAHHQLAVGALRRWGRRPRAVLAPPFDVLALHSDHL